MRHLLIFFITLYQKTFSPDHGPLRTRYPYGFCKFYPSCSEYGRRAFHKYGMVVGLLKTAHRVLRCNPFTHGGIDEP